MVSSRQSTVAPENTTNVATKAKIVKNPPSTNNPTSDPTIKSGNNSTNETIPSKVEPSNDVLPTLDVNRPAKLNVNSRTYNIHVIK